MPTWASGDATFVLNGKAIAVDGKAGSYATLKREWKKGDTLALTVPASVRTEALHGAPDQVAFIYGPVVLAGDLGPAPSGPNIPYAKEQAANFNVASVEVPTLAGDPRKFATSLRRLPGDALAFQLTSDSPRKEITLRPFSELHYQRYNVYWKTTPAKQALRD